MSRAQRARHAAQGNSTTTNNPVAAGGNGNITLAGATPAIQAILSNPLGPWKTPQLEQAWTDVQRLARTSRDNMLSTESAYGFIESCRTRHQAARLSSRSMAAGGGGGV